MIYQINPRWFKSPTRHEFTTYIQERMSDVTKQMVDYNLYDQPSTDVTYSVSVLGAMITVLNLISYLAVDPTGRRPWLARTQVKHKLDINEFKEYIGQVVTMLNTTPPSTNYAALVHIQTVINFLTTMEFNNGHSTNK